MSHSASDVVAALRTVKLFQGLQDADLAKVAAIAEPLELEAGDTMVSESEVGREIFALIRGHVGIDIHIPGRSNDETIAELRDGDMLGEGILLGRTRRIASAVARSPVYALRWENTKLEALFEAHPQVGYRVMRNLASILQERLSATNMMLRNAFNRIVDIL